MTSGGQLKQALPFDFYLLRRKAKPAPLCARRVTSGGQLKHALPFDFYF